MRAGDYDISIRFSDQSIPDSPFSVYVSAADSSTIDLADLDQQLLQVRTHADSR